MGNIDWRKEWRKEVKQYSTQELLHMLEHSRDYNNLYIEIVRDELASRPDLNKVSLTIADIMDTEKLQAYYRKEVNTYCLDRLDYIINSGIFLEWLVNLAIEEVEKRTGKIILPRKMTERI